MTSARPKKDEALNIRQTLAKHKSKREILTNNSKLLDSKQESALRPSYTQKSKGKSKFKNKGKGKGKGNG